MKTHIECECGREVLIPRCGNCEWWKDDGCNAPVPMCLRWSKSCSPQDIAIDCPCYAEKQGEK